MFVPTPLWPETSRFRQTEKTGCVMSPWQFEALFSSELFAVYNTLHVAVIVSAPSLVCVVRGRTVAYRLEEKNRAAK